LNEFRLSEAGLDEFNGNSTSRGIRRRNASIADEASGIHRGGARTGPVVVRSAAVQDHDAIVALVRGGHLNPLDLDWRRFVVAADPSGIVGAVQMRRHADGSRELGSLVVREDARRRGIAGRLIDTLLASDAARVFMITGAAFAAHYARWGFRRIGPGHAPRAILRNYLVGRLVGGLISLAMGRRPRRLAVLTR
jgi:amino-acid N-acetyltransferase